MHPHPTPRRASRALIATALLAVAPLAVALLVTSCGPAPSRGAPTATPTPTATALYASDEEALAAAEEVYREYLDASNAGPDFVRLAAVTTPEWFEYEKDSSERRAASGLRAEGVSKIVSFELQSHSVAEIAVYVCLDVSGVRIVNEQGVDVTPAERADRGTLEVRFAVTEAGPRVNGSDLWSNSCS